MDIRSLSISTNFRSVLPTILVCAICLSIWSPYSTAAVSGIVILQGNENAELKRTIESRLSAIVSTLENNDVAKFSDAFTQEGLIATRALLDRVGLRNARPVHETRLLTLPKGGYEVRDIRVQVSMGETQGSPYQYLVFSLNTEGKITDLRFAMERRHYEDLVDTGEQLQDFVQRQQILQTVEFFRTAYNRKDLEYIERIFSDDALIIVGNVVKERPDLPSQDGRLANSLLGQKRIEFIRRSKGEYVDALRSVFLRSDFLRVDFDSLQVVRDLQDEALYGITLKQQWQSSSYSDTGYVFLLMDFVDPDQPLIHVRSWQPERFDDGSTITLQDFEIIRSE